MKRTQLQLDESTYEALRRKAFEEGKSISAVARELLADGLGEACRERRLTIDDFPFVGAGRSRQGKLQPVSERHDEALVDALKKKGRR
jgi:hypothetical protein